MGDDHKMKGGKSQAPTVHIKKFFAQAKKQVAAAAGEKKPAKKSSRLYVKGVVAGFRRALTNQKSHTSLIKIQGVECSKDWTSTRVGRSCTCTAPRPCRARTGLVSASCGVRCALPTVPAALSVASSARTCLLPPLVPPFASCSSPAACKH